MHNNKLQNFLVIHDITTVIPDLPGSAIQRLFRAREEVWDEELGIFTPGPDIVDASMEQRILTNYLQPYPFWKSRELCHQVVGNPTLVVYSPKPVGLLGEPIEPEVDLIGQTLTLIPVVRMPGLEEALVDVRRQLGVGGIRGTILEKDVIPYYFTI